MPLARSLVVVALLAAPVVAQPVNKADVKPGLVFTAEDEGGAKSERLAPGVGLNLAVREGADPRSDGGRHFTWQGTVNVVQAGKYRFDATVHGTATVWVDKKIVFHADRHPAKPVRGEEVELKAGLQEFMALLTRDGDAARLDLLWSGPGFRPERVPYFFFGHLPKDRPAGFAETQARDHGRFLVEEHACVKCHAADPAGKLAERTGPNLTKIAERANPGWLDAWLKDPHALRPHTTMPKMFAADAAGAAERYAVVAYLSGLGTPPRAGRVSAGEMTKSVAAGQKLYVTVGCATCHGEQVTTGQNSAKKLTGEEDEPAPFRPADSLYALGTNSPQVAYTLGHPGSKFTAEALAKYLTDPLATNPHGRMPSLNLSDAETRDIARYLARITDDKLAAEMPPAPPAPEGVKKKLSPGEWAGMGQQVFAAKGCVNCHAVDTAKAAPLKATPLAKLAAKPGAGCLSAKPDPAKHPTFALDARQTADIAVLVKGLTRPHAPSPVYEARASFKRFGCLNCHNRDGEGGIPEGLAAKMKSLETAENADDVAPPRLTQVGHKLRESWLKGVLLNGARARPWMSLRMPQYGAANVGYLVTGLPKLEGAAPDDTLGKVPVTAAKIDAGRTLAGKSGMGCVACHDISGVTGGGTRGPDLARTHERVRLDWYVRWMHQPQRLAPGTKMPSNFLDGKSLFPTVLSGDADQQIESLWAYLSLGPGLPLPTGMEPPKGLIVSVGDRPELLRTFMPDNAGTRPVAIGFPGGVNAVFDTATCRVSYAWAGNFLDATPVWKDRGGNQARLLGPKFWTGPAGFPWATTGATGEAAPDFARQFADPAYGHQLSNDSYSVGPRHVHFLGYATDAAGVPSFTYELRDKSAASELTVTETVTPLPVLTAPGFRRTLTVTPGEGRVTWLYVGSSEKEPRVQTLAGDAVAAKPETPAAGTRLVLTAGGERTVVVELAAAPKDAVWVVTPAKSGYAVVLKLPTAAKTVLPLDVWGLPRPDEVLLKGLRK